MKVTPAETSAPRHLVGDSLKLAAVSVAVAVMAGLAEGFGLSRGGLLVVGSALFLTPAMALLTLAFSIRDLRHQRDTEVAVAAFLTVAALAISWWPLLQAD